jgi:hypothetical protein
VAMSLLAAGMSVKSRVAEKSRVIYVNGVATPGEPQG